MASVGKKNIQWNLLTASDPGNEAIAERRCLIKQVTTLVPWVTLYNIKRHTQFGRCCPWTGKEVCMHNVSAWPNDPKMVCFFGLMWYAGRPKQIKSTNNLQNIVEKWWNVMCTNNIQQLKKYLLEVRGNLTTLCICKQFPLLSHMDSPCFFLIKWSSPTPGSVVSSGVLSPCWASVVTGQSTISGHPKRQLHTAAAQWIRVFGVSRHEVPGQEVHFAVAAC